MKQKKLLNPEKNLTAVYLYDSFSEKIDFMQKQIFTLLEKQENQQKLISILSHEQDNLQQENKLLKERLSYIEFKSPESHYRQEIQNLNESQLIRDLDLRMKNIKDQYIQDFERQILNYPKLKESNYSQHSQMREKEQHIEDFKRQMQKEIDNIQRQNRLKYSEVDDNISHLKNSLKTLSSIQRQKIDDRINQHFGKQKCNRSKSPKSPQKKTDLGFLQKLRPKTALKQKNIKR